MFRISAGIYIYIITLAKGGWNLAIYSTLGNMCARFQRMHWGE
jgi:hypothetical protein